MSVKPARRFCGRVIEFRVEYSSDFSDRFNLVPALCLVQRVGDMPHDIGQENAPDSPLVFSPSVDVKATVQAFVR
jgi:hypothetical protein